MTTAPAAASAENVAAVEAPARDPIDEIRDLLAEAIELAAVDLRCDTKSAALFLVSVLAECPELAGPTVH
jgi:hypothetical protein